MVTKTELTTIGDVVLFEEDAAYSRDLMTVVSGQTLALGTVVGTLANGKIAVYDPDADDGTEAVSGVVLEHVDASGGDVANVFVLVRHARVKNGGLIFGASVDDSDKRDTARAELKALGILTDL